MIFFVQIIFQSVIFRLSLFYVPTTVFFLCTQVWKPLRKFNLKLPGSLIKRVILFVFVRCPVAVPVLLSRCFEMYEKLQNKVFCAYFCTVLKYLLKLTYWSLLFEKSQYNCINKIFYCLEKLNTMIKKRTKDIKNITGRRWMRRLKAFFVAF